MSDNPTRSNDGQYGSVILDQGESWSQAADAPNDPLAHINALIPVDSSAGVVLDTATGNCDGLTGVSFTIPILGRWTAIAVNASSGSVQLVFG